MEHQDLNSIAFVYPYGDWHPDCLSSLEQSSLCTPNVLLPGQSTLRGPRIDIRHDNPPHTYKGILFGKSRLCHVRIPGAVSSIAFSINFNAQGRLVVRDRNRTSNWLYGTQVSYDSQGGQRRTDFQWIVGGSSRLRGINRIVIKLNAHIQFQIVPVYSSNISAELFDKIEWFRRGNPLNDQTTAYSHRAVEDPPPPPSAEDAIFLRRSCGEGTTSSVLHYWNVSSGQEMVLKRPNIGRGAVAVVEMVKHENHLMEQVKHPHLVESFRATAFRRLGVQMKYYPYGSIDQYQRWSPHQCTMILHQCVSALAFLHSGSTAIIHGNIKPSNIIVADISNGAVHVRLADFALLPRDLDLTMEPETLIYTAPEIMSLYRDRRANGRLDGKDESTPAGDIWSVGFAVWQIHSDLRPNDRQTWSPLDLSDWGQLIVQKMSAFTARCPNHLAHFILDKMVIEAPHLRSTARDLERDAQCMLGENFICNCDPCDATRHRQSPQAVGPLNTQAHNGFDFTGDLQWPTSQTLPSRWFLHRTSESPDPYEAETGSPIKSETEETQTEEAQTEEVWRPNPVVLFSSLHSGNTAGPERFELAGGPIPSNQFELVLENTISSTQSEVGNSATNHHFEVNPQSSSPGLHNSSPMQSSATVIPPSGHIETHQTTPSGGTGHGQNQPEMPPTLATAPAMPLNLPGNTSYQQATQPLPPHSNQQAVQPYQPQGTGQSRETYVTSMYGPPGAVNYDPDYGFRFALRLWIEHSPQPVQDIERIQAETIQELHRYTHEWMRELEGVHLGRTRDLARFDLGWAQFVHETEELDRVGALNPYRSGPQNDPGQ